MLNSVVEQGSDLVLKPLIADVTDRTFTPNFLFSASVDPKAAPVDGDSTEVRRFAQWARRFGGIPYSDRSLEVVLRGRDSSPVVIGDVRIRVLERTAPSGAWVNGWYGCGGALPVRLFKADLVPEPPLVRLYIDGVETERSAFQVSSSEVEVFDFEVTAGRELVSWVIEVRYTSDGRDGVLTITDEDGKPFQLAGGGDPLVFSVWGPTDPSKLTRDDDYRLRLRQENHLC